jgi:arylsulfatase A-like enzyme
MLIILITLDCLRKDHFNEELTPKFMKSHGEWTSFENGFSQSQNTLSSHFTMLTSNYLFQHGVYSNFKGKKLPAHSVDKLLRNSGFDTKALCGVSFLSSLLGNQIGEKDPYFDYSGGGILNAVKRKLRGERRPAEKVLSAGMKWILDKNRAKNSFLWMHLFDAHMAYTAPDRYTKKFVKEKKAEKSVKEQISDEGWFSPYFKEYEKNVTPDYFPGSYKAAVNYIDDSIDTFWGILKQLNLFDDALIFLTSDHGECLKGDHDIYCAHKKLFNETINVPFFVKFPGREFRGVKSDLLAEHTDIAPTIAGYLSKEDSNYAGSDLRKIMSGQAKPRNYVFSEHVDNYMRSLRDMNNIYVEIVEGAENKWGMKVEKEKLFRRDGAPVIDDGLELKFKKEMDKFMQDKKRPAYGDENSDGGSKEIEEQLRSLGYL